MIKVIVDYFFRTEIIVLFPSASYYTGVLPVMMYSAALWGLKEFTVMNTVLNKAGRFLLGLPPKAPNIATQGELGWNSVIYHSRLQVIRLFCCLNSMDNLILTKIVFNWSSNIQINNCKNWVFNVKKFLKGII